MYKRQEHMFFEEDRIAAFREMICSDTVEEREAALEKILPYQQGDFEALYEALEGNPVTIRFLDPPLHEFVPTEEDDIKKLADAQGKTVEEIKTIISSLHEFNPMMGHRGDVYKRQKFDNEKRLKELLEELKLRMNRRIVSSGDSVARLRAMSYYSKAYYLRDQIAGLAFYEFISDIVDNFNEKKDEVIACLLYTSIEAVT